MRLWVNEKFAGFGYEGAVDSDELFPTTFAIENQTLIFKFLKKIKKLSIDSKLN